MGLDIMACLGQVRSGIMLFWLSGDKQGYTGRNNSKDVDLNRNFPCRYPKTCVRDPMQPEVSAVLNWSLSYPFVLSSNLHGGSLVANYPYDDTEDGKSIWTPSPDELLFRKLAYTYAKVSGFGDLEGGEILWVWVSGSSNYVGDGISMRPKATGRRFLL